MKKVAFVNVIQCLESNVDKRALLVLRSFQKDDAAVKTMMDVFKDAGVSVIHTQKPKSLDPDWLMTHARHLRNGETISILTPEIAP